MERDLVYYSVTTKQISKIHDFSGGMFWPTQLNASTQVKILRLSIAINFTKDKKDNIRQLGDYNAPFCERQYTHGSCYISLFKFKSFDQFNTPKTASNFSHLLSCDTIDFVQYVK